MAQLAQTPDASAGARGEAEIKGHGIHYTPPELAAFLAARVVHRLDLRQPELAVLDPACGEGELLAGIVGAVGAKARKVDLVGIDRDDLAVRRARLMLATLDARSVELTTGDFLAPVPTGQLSLVSDDQTHAHPDPLAGRRFDAVISNPPYVRTQVLGAGAARDLAERFELSGRVDLYQAFVRAMTPYIRPGGVLGLLCSNRFLTVQAGKSLRELLSREYELCEVFDLGDTKLFAAAVLPAIVIARRVSGQPVSSCSFTRAYEYVGPDTPSAESNSVVAALEDSIEGIVAVGGQRFEIERGELMRSTSSTVPWRLTHKKRERWLETIAENTATTFAEIGEIRVGIKTTADRVFIRETWDDLPLRIRPEPELLHPLLTHHLAARWQARRGACEGKTVLYPHTISRGKRCAIDLDAFPRARAYLESHRDVLVARAYVIKAGRKWYEIWVPQQPEDWPKPKIVFPDISDTPRFFLDTSGAIVNGDCYWMALESDISPELASLTLAVANSSFALAFYDAVCGNRLYAGRRRFITQYVKRFPLPALDSSSARTVHELVGRVLALPSGEAEARAELEAELDVLVWEGFGLREKIAR